MIARGGGHAPTRGFGTRSLEILENYSGVLDMLGTPLRLSKHDPVQRALGAFFQCVRQERLGMAKESHFAGRETKLFPDEPHEAVRIRAAGSIAMATGCEHESNLLRRSCFRRHRARDLIGESLNYQWMRWIDIIVMKHNARVFPPCLADRTSESFALQQIEIESGGKYENLAGTAAIDGGGELTDGCQLDIRSKT
ncbi:MAG TPA: hypothetical protein VME17_12370 [Bryobacteraceae bacterium]|nr:hypothetical protein [Bryobacteraceae bacterium]